MTKRATSRRTTASPRSRPTAATSTGPRTSTPGKIFEYNKDPQRPDLRHQAARPRDRQDRPLRHGPGRLDPADALARRQVARLHPPRALQVVALRQGPRVGRTSGRSSTASSATCRRPGRSRASIPAWRGRRTRVDRLLGRRQDPPRRTFAGEQVAEDSVPCHGHAQAARRPRRRAGSCRPGRTSRPDRVPRPHAALGRRLARRQARRLPGARLHLRARPAQRHAAAPHDADRPLRVLSRPGRATPSPSSTRPGTTRRSGSIRVAPRVRPATPRVVTDKPGHYLEPVFSPDGAKSSTAKDTGGYLRSTALVRRARPLLVSGRGRRRSPTLVSRTASRRASARPPTASSSSRPRAARTRSRRKSASSPRSSSTARTCTSTTSPSSPRSSRSRPTGSGSPSARVSTRTSRPSSRPAAASTSARRARRSPSRGSRRTPASTSTSPATPRELYWSFGPQLFQRDLKEAFAFLPGAPEKLPGAAGRGARHRLRRRGRRAHRRRRLHRRPRRDDERATRSSRTASSSSRATASRPSARGRAVAVPAGREDRSTSRARRSCPGSSTPTGTAPSARDGIMPQQNWHTRRLPRLRRHDRRTTPRNDTGEVFAAAELARAGLVRGAAHLLDRHDPLRRRRRLQGRDRLARRRPVAPAAHEGRRRLLRQELQPAAPRPAPADPRRRRARSASWSCPRAARSSSTT